MTRQSLTRIAAGAAVAGLVALGASPAAALPHPFSSTSSSSTSSTLPGGAPSGQAATSAQAGNQAKALTFLQNAGVADITARLTSLNKAISDLANVPQGCDVSPLVTTANNDIAGLTALEGHLKADTTVAEAKADVQQIFAGFRVYALVIPVDEMVVASCRMTDLINKVNALVQKLQHVSDPNITALVTGMGNNAQAAANALNGVAGTLETLDAKSWDSNPSELVQYRQDLRTARKDLEQCRDEAHQIVGILRHDYSPGSNGGNAVNPNANSSTSTTASTSSTVAA